MFLDRDIQRSIIQNSLSNHKSVFIYAESGIGKSALCEEVLKNNPNTIVLKRRSSRDLFDEGDIIIRMCQEINKRADILHIKTFRQYSKKYRFSASFIEFLSTIDSLQISVNLSPIVIISLPIILTTKWLIKLFIPKNVRDSWRKPDGGKVNLLQCKKYLYYVLGKNKDLIFDINNIQAIDKTSFDFIIELMKKFGIRFLLQFTGDVGAGERFYHNDFSDVNELLCPLPLPFLPEEETRKLIDVYNNSEVNKDQLLSEFLRTGNLNPIVKINMKKNTYYFTSHENAIIWFLKIFNGKVRKRVLFKHMKKMTDLNEKALNNIMQKLQDEQIIFREAGFYVMRHIEFEANITTKATVFKELCSYLKKHPSNLKLLQDLIPYFLEFNPRGLLEYLPQIRQIMLYVADQRTALDLIEQIKCELIRARALSEQVNLFIIDLYYSLAMYQQAYDYLIETDTSNTTYTLYKAMLLNRLDLHDESIEVIQSSISTMSDRERVIAFNIQLINYASLRNRKKMREYYNKILEVKDVAKYPEFQFALRNSHLVLARPKAIQCIKKCISYFKSHNDSVNVNQAQISLAMLYILDKKNEKAKKMLKRINKCVHSQAMELSVSLNNLATIYMTQGKYIDAEKHLQDAEQISLDLFSTLSIYGNMLTVKTQTNDIEGGNIYVNKILNLLLQEPDKKLKSCLYDEIFHYYIMANDIPKAKQYELLSKKMLDEISTDVRTTNTAVRTTLGFIINQLAFWHFDLFPLLECFQ